MDLEEYNRLTGNNLTEADAMRQLYPWVDEGADFVGQELAQVPLVLRDELFRAAHLVDRCNEQREHVIQDIRRFSNSTQFGIKLAEERFWRVAKASFVYQPGPRCPVHGHIQDPGRHWLYGHLACQSLQPWVPAYQLQDPVDGQERPVASAAENAFRSGQLCLLYATKQYFAELGKVTRGKFASALLDGPASACPTGTNAAAVEASADEGLTDEDDVEDDNGDDNGFDAGGQEGGDQEGDQEEEFNWMDVLMLPN
eukprot:m.157439 g.157439  ORF g.157439 m.157439 type:complete len:255 (-) comp17582_c0_seq4:28-792(-)